MAKDGPLGFVHFDAHTDLFDGYFGGQRYTHGTPFRRAVEEGLLDPARMIQIGIRGTTYDGEDRAFASRQGIRIVPIEEFRARGVEDVMAEAREILGGGPSYLSFDIDGIDPASAPGTGTPEIGGFSTFEAQAMLRLLDGTDIVAADLVEVSPPFDPSGVTAWIGASVLFEILCITATAVARRKGRTAVICETIPLPGR
jgi:guanidinopropionase